MLDRVRRAGLRRTCNAPGGFDAFIAEIKKDAAAQGVSKRGLAALNGVTLDDKVLAADKRQGVFKQTFEEFSGRMISRDRLTKGARLMQPHAATLRKMEQQFGVPGRSSSRSGVLRPTTASTRARCRSDSLGRDAGVRLPPHRQIPGAN